MDVANLASQLNAGTIWPEGIVIITLLAVLVTDLIAGRKSVPWTPYIAIGGLLASIAAIVVQWQAAGDAIGFLGAFNSDPIGLVFRGIIALSTVTTILMSIRYVEQSGTSLAEFLAILLSATLGAMFLSSANDLVTIFVSLETLSISSYLLTGYMKRDSRSNEAALKYLLIGASSSAVFLYGVSLLYGLSGGEVQLDKIAVALVDSEASLGLALALVFTITGIAFKISAVPFHQWTPAFTKDRPHLWLLSCPSARKQRVSPWRFACLSPRSTVLATNGTLSSRRWRSSVCCSATLLPYRKPV